MVTCSIIGCKNRSDSSNVKFHRFPKKEEYLNLWLQVCPHKKNNHKNGILHCFLTTIF